MTTQDISDSRAPGRIKDDAWLSRVLARDPVPDKELLELLVNGVTQYAIMTLDRGGSVTNWNTGAERIHGYASDEILGQNFAVFYTEEDRQAGVPRRALETAVQTGKYEAEAWRVRKDGSRFMANVLVEPLRDDAGNLLGFAMLTRDTERARGPTASSGIGTAMGQPPRSQFGTLLHDLNNSLHVIKNGLVLVRRLQIPGSQATDVIDVMMRNADCAAGLAQHLHDLSRSTPREAEPVNLNTLVAGMVELLRRVLSDGITVETVLGSDLSRVSADPRHVQNVLLSLAIQARDSMSQRGRLRIETRNVLMDEAYAANHPRVAPGSYVMISVANTGTGMTKEIIARAFEAFVAEDDEPRAALDAARVYGSIEQLDAHVEIHSEPSTGTTVKLYLPKLRPLRASEASGAPPGGKASAASGSGEAGAVLSGLRVVVIEDEALIRMHVEDLVTDLGGKVVAIGSSVSEALDVVNQTPMDLALLDVNLSGEQVYPVAEALRARGVPFIFISGYGEVDVSWRERPVLQKPLELEKLRLAARAALGRKH